MKGLLTFGLFAGTIAGIIIIKLLDLPWYLTIPLVGALLVGVIIILAKVMGDGEKKDTPEGGM